MIGLWGCFDTDSLDDQLVVRVVRAELARRLPHCTIRAFAPLGSLRPTPLDGGELVEPLAPADAPLVRALDETLSLVVLTGDLARWDPPALTAEYGFDDATAARVSRLALTGAGVRAPRAWHAVENVDAVATEPPAYAGPPVGTTTMHQLAANVIGEDVLARRLAFVRAVGWCPADERFVVVHSHRDNDVLSVVENARGRIKEIGASAVVVVPTGRDADVAHELANALDNSYLLPPIASIEDRVATSRAAVAVIPTLDRTERPVAVDELHTDYDAIAALVSAAATGPLVGPEVSALRAALDARGRRLAAERVAFADALRAAHAERDQARTELMLAQTTRGNIGWGARARNALARLRPGRHP